MTATAFRRPASHMGAGRVAYSYERLSKFRPKDYDREVTRPVHRQKNDAIKIADDKNLGPLVHLTDEGQSASRFASKARDNWPVLLEAVRAGKVSYVLVWLLDRVIRQTRDLDDLLDACRETGTLILQTGTGTTIDADDPDSVAMAKIAGVLAEAEVAKMSKRVRRAHAEKAVLGQFHGGKRRFGYSVDMKTVDPVEADIIRTMAADIIAGRSLHSIARELNGGRLNGPDKPAVPATPPPLWNGVPFAMGKWTGPNLGVMMRRPHLAGLRATGKDTTAATWDPILTVETWEAVCAVLTADGRRTNSAGTARKWLLSGVARCGVCGGPVRSRTGRLEKAYACPDNHVHRSQSLTDAVVVAEVIGRLSDPDFEASFLPEADTDRTAIDARMEFLEGYLEDVEADVVAQRTTRRAAEKGKADAMAEIIRLKGRLSTMAAAATLPAVFDGVAGPDAAAAWDGLDLDRRRAIVDTLMTVTVERAARRGAAFDPDSIRIRWKTEAE